MCFSLSEYASLYCGIRAAPFHLDLHFPSYNLWCTFSTFLTEPRHEIRSRAVINRCFGIFPTTQSLKLFREIKTGNGNTLTFTSLDKASGKARVCRNAIVASFSSSKVERSTCVFANMHSCKPAITFWPSFRFVSCKIHRSLQILSPLFYFIFSFNQRFVQEFLGFECPCRGNISLKHKAPDTC